MSLSYTAHVRAMSQLMYFFSLIVMPMFYLGGVFFPLDDLPRGFQIAAWFLPITHVVEINRWLISGDWDWTVPFNFLWIVIAAGAFYLVALWRVRKRMIV
jgi:lipooligosaccharide transport system permease protein